MTTILAIDTATQTCSVAVFCNGQVIEKQSFGQQKQHSQVILTLIKDILSDLALSFNNLDVIAFGRGPGAFTGLRLAAGVTQSLAFAYDLPVIAISSLNALANSFAMNKGSHQQLTILASIDARMGDIYGAFYKLNHNKLFLMSDEFIMNPDQLNLPENHQVNTPLIGVGSGLSYQNEIEKSLNTNFNDVYQEFTPTASAIAKLAYIEYQQGKMLSAEQAIPVYLRNKVTG